jgi:hypothetical protein
MSKLRSIIIQDLRIVRVVRAIPGVNFDFFAISHVHLSSVLRLWGLNMFVSCGERATVLWNMLYQFVSVCENKPSLHQLFDAPFSSFVDDRADMVFLALYRNVENEKLS